MTDKRKKLTAEQVQQIRAAKGSLREIAKQFNISNAHVCNLKAGRARKD